MSANAICERPKWPSRALHAAAAFLLLAGAGAAPARANPELAKKYFTLMPAVPAGWEAGDRSTHVFTRVERPEPLAYAKQSYKRGAETISVNFQQDVTPGWRRLVDQPYEPSFAVEIGKRRGAAQMRETSGSLYLYAGDVQIIVSWTGGALLEEAKKIAAAIEFEKLEALR
jgi:hypothetical protein